MSKGSSMADETVARAVRGGRGRGQGSVHGRSACPWRRSLGGGRRPLPPPPIAFPSREDAPDREGVPHPYLNEEDCVGATCVGRLDDEGRRAAFALDNDVINVCARLVHPLCDPDVTYHST